MPLVHELHVILYISIENGISNIGVVSFGAVAGEVREFVRVVAPAVAVAGLAVPELIPIVVIHVFVALRILRYVYA
jgi:hypothetical protein